MPVTFDKYMDNPSDGTSIYTMREYYRKIYKDKFDILMVREQGHINYKIYQTKDSNDTFYIHLKIPSESNKEIYYDVVVQLYTPNRDEHNSVTLRNYFAKFYSNDQAFVYTFAYGFNKHNLFIDDLKVKMIPRCLKDPGEHRNPNGDVWYVKSICFAYYTMERYHLFTRTVLTQNCTKYTRSSLLSNVMSAADKIEEYRIKKPITHKPNKSSQKHQQQNILKVKNISKVSSVSKSVKTTRSVKYTSRIKSK